MSAICRHVFIPIVAIVLTISFAAGAQDIKRWPLLYGRAGSYGIQTPEEIDSMSNAGFSLLALPYQPTTDKRLQAMLRDGVQYIDMYIWDSIFFKVCQPQFKSPLSSCVIDSAAEQNVLDDVRKHLKDTAQDKNILGYWVLDDYPRADIHALLEKIHEAVSEVNSNSVIKRPTICSFGGTLDSKKKNTDPTFVSNFRYVDKAVINFTPRGCDMVALYPYGSNYVDDPATIDWSMGPLLSHTFQMLKDKGWDQNQQPLIGIVQTFGYGQVKDRYVTPREKDITEQFVSFCKAGATTVLFYSWDDTYKGNKSEPGNTPYMTAALQSGLKQCRSSYWTAGSR